MLVLHLLSNPNSWRLIHFNTLWFTITVAEIEFRKKNNFEILSNFFSGFCGPSGQNSPGQDILKYKYFPLNFFETILSRFDRKSNSMSIWLFPISCHFDSRPSVRLAPHNAGSPFCAKTPTAKFYIRKPFFSKIRWPTAPCSFVEPSGDAHPPKGQNI